MRKRIALSFAAGLMTGALLFGGTLAYAAGVLAERSTNAVYVNGRRAELEAYQINGANYVKLRDLARAVNINVFWDGNVQIDTSAPYTGEAPTPKQTETNASPTLSNIDPAIFSGDYTRELFNALRQTITTGVASDSFPLTSETERQAAWNAAAAVGSWPGYSLESAGNGRYRFTAKYPTAYQGAADYCKPFIDGLAGMSDRDKVREIAFYVCDHLTYDAGSTSGPNQALVSDGVSKGNCMSYAHNFKFLCDLAGIPCIFTHSANHQWNQVYVEGRWWHVDVSGTDAGDDAATQRRSPVLYDESYLQGVTYRQTEPELTVFAKVLLAP